jgi:hypothetical protein
VGIGMRLSWLKRVDKAGPEATRKAMIKRYCILVLIAFAIYMGWIWDALMDIGLAGLLAVYLVDKSPKIRVAAAFIMVGIYQAFVMFTSYGPWIMRQINYEGDTTPFLVKLIPYHSELFDVALNGGPLGPLSWCMMLLLGTVAYDLSATGDRAKLVKGCLAWGIGLCVAGWVMSMQWGGVKAEWPISAYYMTVPFPLWASGLCFLQLLAFHVICDVLNIRIPTFTSVGMNPLFIYILHILVLNVLEESFDMPDFNMVTGILGFGVFYRAFALLAYILYRKKIIIKL